MASRLSRRLRIRSRSRAFLPADAEGEAEAVEVLVAVARVGASKLDGRQKATVQVVPGFSHRDAGGLRELVDGVQRHG
jgi:hypothetical protein